MADKKADRKVYKEKNKQFLIKLSKKDGINELPKRVLYEVVKSGDGSQKPGLNNVISVHYQGSLIDGSIFDSSRDKPYPETLRLSEVIEGWQIAISEMVAGDIWRIYLPSDVGYGKNGVQGIPPWSSLIFEVELISIS